MPTFERLTSEQLNERSRHDHRDFVLSCLAEGRFDVLTPVQRVVFAFFYVSDTYFSVSKIGVFFDPPKEGSYIHNVACRGLKKLERLESITHKDLPWVYEVGLSQSSINAIKRTFGAADITPEQFLTMSDVELLKMRNFGQKSLMELREKLATHFQSGNPNEF